MLHALCTGSPTAYLAHVASMCTHHTVYPIVYSCKDSYLVCVLLTCMSDETGSSCALSHDSSIYSHHNVGHSLREMDRLRWPDVVSGLPKTHISESMLQLTSNNVCS